MKTIYIVRHAKSSWGDISLKDFDRPLNERGATDAPAMAKRLINKKVKIDAFISSPAKRALKTCKLFCEEFGVKKDKIVLENTLYEAGVNAFYNVVEKTDDDYKSVAIFSHNPGITAFVNTLCNEKQIDNMPTCAVFAVEADTKKWKDFKTAEKKFLFFEYPKGGD